jgi:hypothetical protein
MVTAGILRTPIAGRLFERCGAIRTRIAAAPTRPTTATAAFPGGVAPRDIPA